MLPPKSRCSAAELATLPAELITLLLVLESPEEKEAALTALKSQRAWTETPSVCELRGGDRW